jgi:hypothetical protein
VQLEKTQDTEVNLEALNHKPLDALMKNISSKSKIYLNELSFTVMTDEIPQKILV